MKDGTIPRIGLGTWPMRDAEAVEAIRSGLRLGYRHIDTAQGYDNEDRVGEAIAGSGLAPDEVFVTTKIAGRNLTRLIDSLGESLGRLGLDSVDLTLIHWPSTNDEIPVSQYMADLARAQDLGTTRLIGVSNFTRRHIDEAVAAVGEGRVATNQVELHPYLQNRVLAAHCAELDIPLTAYMPIAKGAVGTDAVLGEIAAAHGATAEQVSLAFLLARGHIVIPKSANPERQRLNLAAADLTLSEDEMERIGRLDRGKRYVNPATAPDWD